MASQYKRYNHELGDFTDWPELQVFDLFDNFMTGVPLSLEKDRVRMSDVGIYDIAATMVRSLRNLKKLNMRLARGFGDAITLREVVGADTGVDFLVDTSLFPLFDEPELPTTFYSKVLETGVAGLIVRPDMPDGEVLQGLSPETLILQRVMRED